MSRAVTLLVMLMAPAFVAGAQPGLVRIPGGSYEPLYATHGQTVQRVAPFALDREPVTVAAFQRFVTANPSWRRDSVTADRAESGYLEAWKSALDVGREAPDAPVTNVSWFAAKAYCASRGKRLPTTDEWEYVAAASATSRNAAHDARQNTLLLAAYTTRASRGARVVGKTRPNAFGVADLHELVWEWTEDFDGTPPNAHHGTVEHDDHLSCASAALGSTNPSNYAAFLRYAFRSGLTKRTTTRSLGFRCATAA